MGKNRLIDRQVTLSNIVGPTTFDIELEYADILSIQAVATVTTPSDKTFTAAVTDICTAVAHGFITGLKVRGSTTTTLPAGISLATDYFVIVLSADTFSLATTYALALAGTVVDITDTGTGTHTLTPTVLAGGSVKLQKSNFVSAGFSDEGSATNVTVAATVWLEKDKPGFRYARFYATVTAGSLAITLNIIAKD